MRPWVRLTLRVSGWAVLLAAVGVLAATVVVPRAIGGHAYAVTSGSMLPTLTPGSVVVVRPVDTAKIDIGSIITFQMEAGRPGVATHRVLTQGMRDYDEPILHTRGDANDVGDAEWVRPVQVKGEVWYSVPFVGRLTNLMPNDAKQLGVASVATALLGYAGGMFLLTIRDRRRARHA